MRFRCFKFPVSKTFDLLRQESRTKAASSRLDDRVVNDHRVRKDNRKGGHDTAPQIEDAEISYVEDSDELNEVNEETVEDSDIMGAGEYDDESDEAGNESAEAPVPSDGFFNWDEMENFADQLEQVEVCKLIMAGEISVSCC